MTTLPIAIIGFDRPQSDALKLALSVPVIAHPNLPRILLQDGRLWIEGERSSRLEEVGGVIYHGIFEDDMAFLSCLALWGGPCFPNPEGMMAVRLRLPGMVRALKHTRFGGAVRGYVSGNTYVTLGKHGGETERVAKWGDWHCGENKTRFRGLWQAEAPSLIEPFFEGSSVRVVIIGEQAWEIHMAGDTWLKSSHHPDADLVPEIDQDLLDDTRAVMNGLGLTMIANDYIVTATEEKHFLETNHVPNLTHFRPIWTGYRDHIVAWVAQHTS